MHSDFEKLFSPRSEKIETKHDALMLMAGFLSEVESLQRKKKISKKELAKMMGTSPSYLTQVFRSKKPLNFITLAKIKRALNIRFEIKAHDKEEENFHSTEVHEYSPILLTKFTEEIVSNTGGSIPVHGSKFIIPFTSFSTLSDSKGILKTEQAAPEATISINRTLV